MVSIIITAYNVESTLGRAIESCLSQTFSDIEIIVVNDCSPDKSREIALSYDDPRIRLIDHEINMGAGMARRTGTKAAKGEYTVFLDGDDWLDKLHIETLYKNAKEYNADIVSSGIKKVDKNGKVKELSRYKKRFLHGDLLEQNLHQDNALLLFSLNNKMIRRTLWDVIDYNGRRFFEDTPTCYMLHRVAKSMIEIPYAGWNYFDNSKGLTGSASPLKYAIYRVLSTKDMCTFEAENGDERTLSRIRHQFMQRLSELRNLKDFKPNSYLEYKDEFAEIGAYLLTILKV